MGILFNRGDGSAADYGTFKLDGGWSVVPSNISDAIRVRPYKEHDGIETAVEFLKDLHDPPGATSLHSGSNVIHGFEISYTAGRVNFQFVGHDDWWTDNIEASVQRHWPAAQTERAPARLVDLSEGRHVAVATLGLKKYTLYPIRHIGIEGFNSDPFGSIISRMGSANADADTTDVTIQILFQPVDDDWTEGVNGGYDTAMVAKRLEAPRTERGGKVLPIHKYEVDPSDKEKKAAKLVRQQDGDMGWRLAIRIIATSDTPEAAIDRVDDTAGMFRKYYDSATRQNFVTEPIPRSSLLETIDQMLHREWDPTDATIVKSLEETAGLVHVPNSDINQQNVNWALANPGSGVPTGTPRYDFDAAGVATASDAEQAVAMLDRPEYGDQAFWFGRGNKNGIEAGVFEEFLNAHMQVTGRTRMGKTTLATNFGSQTMQRGRGALAILLGKEDDDESFIAEWPEDRPEEDFVFIDTGDQFDKRVRFNLLDIPDHLEPGTAEHTSYMESLADDFCAAFAQAGGDGETLYPLMRGITRTLVRGMSQSDMTCTPIDLAAACSSADNMSRFSRWMSDERIHFIQETAKRFEEKEDADLEPIARRMDEITHNANLRTWLAAREPTVCAQEIVDEEKVAVLRIDPALGDTERAFATNPIVRRFAHAKKMSDKAGTNTNPFYLIWDEADKSATVHSNLGNLLSEYGGYGFRCCLLYQAPSNQLPDSLRDETESQIDTTLSFRTTGKDARFIQEQHTVEKEDLKRLPRFSFYMTTDTRDNDPTDSYMVDAFPPVRELREEAGNVDPLTEEEITAMKRRSVARYGSEPETDEEIKAQSPFYEAGVEEDDGVDTNASPDALRPATCKAVYDEAIRQSADDGWVRVDEAADRIRRYLPADVPLSTTAKLWGNLLDHIPESHLEREDRGTAQYLRCTDEGKTAIFASGAAQNSGGAAHRLLLRDAYKPLTELGFVTEIPDQSGENLPDAVCSLEDVDTLQFDPENESAKEIADRVNQFEDENPLLARLSDANDVYVEAESTTATTAPAQTLLNLKAAVESGHRCLFLARTEEVAERIWEVLAEDPAGMREYEKRQHRLYNTNDDALSIGGAKMYRPAGPRETVWLYDETVDQYLLSDSDGEVHARFDSAEDIFAEPEKYPLAEGETADYDDWAPVKPPVVPTDECLDTDNWDILVVDSSDESTCLQLYDDGELVPVEDVIEHESTVPEFDI